MRIGLRDIWAVTAISMMAIAARESDSRQTGQSDLDIEVSREGMNLSEKHAVQYESLRESGFDVADNMLAQLSQRVRGFAANEQYLYTQFGKMNVNNSSAHNRVYINSSVQESKQRNQHNASIHRHNISHGLNVAQSDKLVTGGAALAQSPLDDFMVKLDCTVKWVKRYRALSSDLVRLELGIDKIKNAEVLLLQVIRLESGPVYTREHSQSEQSFPLLIDAAQTVMRKLIAISVEYERRLYNALSVAQREWLSKECGQADASFLDSKNTLLDGIQLDASLPRSAPNGNGKSAARINIPNKSSVPRTKGISSEGLGLQLSSSAGDKTAPLVIDINIESKPRPSNSGTPCGTSTQTSNEVVNNSRTVQVVNRSSVPNQAEADLNTIFFIGEHGTMHQKRSSPASLSPTVSDQHVGNEKMVTKSNDAPVCPADQHDPNIMINEYIKKENEEKPWKIVIIVRPVSEDARLNICTGQAMGKGQDILPKSTKCESNKGFVSYCQSCNRDWLRENENFDLFEVSAGVYTVGSELNDEDSEKFKNKELGICFGLASMDDKGLCFTTCRKTDENNQIKAAKIMAHPAGDPPNIYMPPHGIPKRVISTREHQGKTVPFLSYITKDDHIFPVVSDYDLLTVGEWPKKGEKGTAKYPLMMEEPDFWKRDILRRLVESTFASSSNPKVKLKKALAHAGSVRILQESETARNDPELKAMAAAIAKQGYGDPGSLIIVKDLIKLSSDLKTMAVAHHMETFNYHITQPVEDDDYPIFWGDGPDGDGKIDAPVDVADPGIGKIHGLNKLVETYLSLLKQGCCVPFNYAWLRQGSSKWIHVFLVGYELAQPNGVLEGCPFYDVAVIPRLIPNVLGWIAISFPTEFAAAALEIPEDVQKAKAMWAEWQRTNPQTKGSRIADIVRQAKKKEKETTAADGASGEILGPATKQQKKDQRGTDNDGTSGEIHGPAAKKHDGATNKQDIDASESDNDGASGEIRGPAAKQQKKDPRGTDNDGTSGEILGPAAKQQKKDQRGTDNDGTSGEIHGPAAKKHDGATKKQDIDASENDNDGASGEIRGPAAKQQKKDPRGTDNDGTSGEIHGPAADNQDIDASENDNDGASGEIHGPAAKRKKQDTRESSNDGTSGEIHK